MLSLARLTYVAFVLGICFHVFLFRRGEWHLQAPKLVQLLSLFSFGITISCKVYLSSSWIESFKLMSAVTTAYLSGVFSSTVLYRRFFHPLKGFPGPILASVSKLWHVWQYGDYVRTGPNELTVFDAEIMLVNSSYRSLGLQKPDWYEFLHPLKSLNSLRDPKEHDIRRRIWDRAFTKKALRNYEIVVHKYMDKLDRQIMARTGTSMELRNWFYFLTFDIIGELTFSKSFDMLENAKWHSGPMVIRDGLRLLSWATPVPWLAHIAFQFATIPIIRDWSRMIAYCRATMLDRMKAALAIPDIAGALIEGSVKQNRLEQDTEAILGDSVALIIAGSDTIAATLVYIFYRLCLHEAASNQLIEEIRTAGHISDDEALRKLPYLNAFISETLRLHPAVPTGGLRQVPVGGVRVNGHEIPCGTILCIPQWSLHRSEDCFVKADAFIPERWIDRPELVKNKLAYAPFSVGRFNCVGKHLGLAELRYVVWAILSKYDFRAANPENLHNVEYDMRDAFTALPGSFEVIFERAACG